MTNEKKKRNQRKNDLINLVIVSDCRAVALLLSFSVNLSGSGSWQIAALSDVSLDFDVTTDPIKTYERAAPRVKYCSVSLLNFTTLKRSWHILDRLVLREESESTVIYRESS